MQHVLSQTWCKPVVLFVVNIPRKKKTFEKNKNFVFMKFNTNETCNYHCCCKLHSSMHNKAMTYVDIQKMSEKRTGSKVVVSSIFISGLFKYILLLEQSFRFCVHKSILHNLIQISYGYFYIISVSKRVNL